MALTDDGKQWLSDQINGTRAYVGGRTHDAETLLLRSFADFNGSVNVRFQKLELVPRT